MNKNGVHKLKYEIRLEGTLELWDSQIIELASIDLFGAIQEANGIITRLKSGYGESFLIQSWIIEGDKN